MALKSSFFWGGGTHEFKVPERRESGEFCSWLSLIKDKLQQTWKTKSRSNLEEDSNTGRDATKDGEVPFVQSVLSNKRAHDTGNKSNGRISMEPKGQTQERILYFLN
ncbi:hypothetical protein Ddc_21876 [Ditylenchus destructor]|nr:hypothetical protein Ddc_21876 [Ditylenchus destructor]